MFFYRNTSVLFFALLCTGLLRGVESSRNLSAKQPRRETLVYFVHESFGGLNKSVEVVAGPNNNLTSTGFGHVSAFDNPIKDGAEDTSTVIGFAAGMATATKHPMDFRLSVTHTVKSTVLGKGTLAFTGKLDLTLPLSEVVVSGGTGHFQFLRGIATIEVVYAAYPFYTYKYTATLVRA